MDFHRNKFVEVIVTELNKTGDEVENFKWHSYGVIWFVMVLLNDLGSFISL